MRIGILCYPTSGGSGVVATEMGAALAERGHEVHIISYRPPFRIRPASDRFHFHRVEIPQYPLFEYPSYGMAAACAIAQVLELNPLDILHAHYAYPHAVSAYLAQRMTGRTPFRVVTTLHGTDIMLVRQDDSFSCMTRFGILQSDAVTAVSEFLRGCTQSWFGVQKPIEVIPNFIDPSRFRPRRSHRRRRERRIVHVSNFRPVKRSEDALRAFYLVRRRAAARLQMIGTGPELDALRALARRLGIAEHVEFMGESRHIEHVLAQADLLLSTSEFEGFGLAPLEAMSCGLPVVATRAGGIREVVEEGRTGYLTAVGDVEGLAERMIALLDDASLARKFGCEGRARACDLFSRDRVLPRYERVYETVNAAAAPAVERRATHA
ncbi:MAG: N-acetyl-alpha-D-glucosaminyl L-malate synthase BshA [Planctomycetes bacterium]|nr:N-acetyl-alpha-D-glucosaminyl L-malate synthase BshA [Planctomycetota bacterium]